MSVALRARVTGRRSEFPTVRTPSPQVVDGAAEGVNSYLKAWNRHVGEPLRSFHLESLAWAIFGTSFWWHESVRSDWASARSFFEKAPEKVSYRLSDPAGFGSDVGVYLKGSALENTISKMNSALNRCKRAERAAMDGDLATLHEAYRGVFGDAYPA